MGKINQTIFDKKEAIFQLQKSKFNKSLKPRDALTFCKDHARVIVKKKELKPKKFNQEITRQYPREEIKFVTEKSTDWFNLYKNAVSLELASPRNKNKKIAVDNGKVRTFRR